MPENFSILLHKLDSFIRRYYLHKLIKGGLLFVSGFIAVFLMIALLEYIGYFNTVTRGVLYYGFLIFTVAVFFVYILKPLAGLIKIGKRISPEDAALLLGKHFKNEVDDKILNTLQLQKFLEEDKETNELILAGIEQKSGRLLHFPFDRAVNFRENVRFVPVALVLILFFVAGWFLFPFILKEPATRIVKYNQHFERPAPFNILFINKMPLQGVKNESFLVEVKTEGDVVPDNMEILIDSKQQPMVKVSGNHFQYEFRSMVKPVDIYLKAGGFMFGPYPVEVISKAVIKNFNLVAQYPPYTRMEDDSYINLGDIRVPEGTILEWQVFTEDADNVVFISDTLRNRFAKDKENIFKMEQQVSQPLDYAVVAYNDNQLRGDSLSYSVNVIPDAFPSVSIEEFQDSILLSQLFFRGLIGDDYGFSSLSFKYRNVETNDTGGDPQTSFSSESIDFEAFNLNQNFFFNADLNKYAIKPGVTFEYFFEVADNDGINGPKATRSRIFSFSIPTQQEMIAETLASDEEVKSGLEESMKEVSTIQDDIDKLRKSMLESENISWEQKETLKNLLDQQKQAQENYEQLKEMSKNENTKQQQFKKQDENILKKQEELEKLFEEVLTDELKELYQQIQEELEKMNKENVFEMLEKMEFEMEDLESRLDRALELFKQLQVERMLSESIETLEEIKEELDQLNEELNQEGLKEETADEQTDINEQFEDLQKLLDDMMSKNEDLTRPNPLEDTGEMQDDIMQDLKDALENMMKGQPAESGESQENASGKMQELGNSLMNMQAQMQQQNLAEDIKTLREILDNLLKTSFSQEQLLEEVKTINIRDPKYIGLIQHQNKISNDLVMIKDSLEALAKRQIQIESYVTREIAEINMNIELAIEHLVNRRKHTGTSRQQFVITHINNLALLLNESMENMQSQMQAQQQGQGDPQSGQSNPGFQDLGEMQKQMNEMLEQMRDGHQPMPGESGESSMSTSEKLARMAAEQEAIRNQLNDIAKEFRKDGQNTKELDQLMREMERTELDIVTNKITRQTQLRQQRILSRLLEHEKAEMEREQEERRVGETAKFYELSNPEDFFEYNRNKNRAMEMLRSMPPGFKPHYKILVELYFLNVQE